MEGITPVVVLTVVMLMNDERKRSSSMNAPKIFGCHNQISNNSNSVTPLHDAGGRRHVVQNIVMLLDRNIFDNLLIQCNPDQYGRL